MLKVLQVSRRPHPRHHEHGRELHFARVALRHSHQRWPGNWCCVDEGLHVTVRRSRHVRPRYQPGSHLHAEAKARGNSLSH